MPLDDYLDARGYGRAFRDDHLYPMAAAIWSTPAAQIGRYPTEAFVRFCENHHLLTLGERPPWRTVSGGSREYVRRLAAALGDRRAAGERRGRGATRRARRLGRAAGGAGAERFDQVVIATHADQALRLLRRRQRRRDAPARRLRLQPQPRRAAQRPGADAAPPRRLVELELRRRPAPRRRALRHLLDEPAAGHRRATPLFLTLNPMREPRPEHADPHRGLRAPAVRRRRRSRAQDELWSLQGRRRTWFCGAYFGSGFHEDGLQAGPRRRRGARRRAPALAGRGRIGPHPRSARAEPPRRRAARMSARAPALYVGSVMHQRLRPVRHRLRYRMFSLLLDLDELPALARRLRLFSLNRFNLFSLHERDYGDRRAARRPARARRAPAARRRPARRRRGPPADACRASSATPSIRSASTSATAATARCRRMLYEVNNTFGERHSYLIPVDAAERRRRPHRAALREGASTSRPSSPSTCATSSASSRRDAERAALSIGVVANDAAGALLNARFDAAAAPLDDAALAARLLQPSAADAQGHRGHPLGSAAPARQGRSPAGEAGRAHRARHRRPSLRPMSAPTRRRLAHRAKRAVAVQDHREVRRAGLRCWRVPARRAINSRPDRRGDVEELVVTNVEAKEP